MRDLVEALVLALARKGSGYQGCLIASDDITTSGKTAREWSSTLHPGVPWRGGPEYDTDPYRTLVDNEKVKSLLGWTPRYRWRDAEIP